MKVGKIQFFVNQDVAVGDKKPRIKSTITFEEHVSPGQYEIALWVNRSKTGDVYYSGNIEKSDEQEAVKENTVHVEDSDLPF